MEPPGSQVRYCAAEGTQPALEVPNSLLSPSGSSAQYRTCEPGGPFILVVRVLLAVGGLLIVSGAAAEIRPRGCSTAGKRSIWYAVTVDIA